jgi:uncharacterized protein (TIGR03435 family)
LFDVPAWATQERYDIVAKFEGGTAAGAANTAAMRQMLRTLLAERFNLVLRRETRNVPVYFLELDRSDGRLGPGLRPSTRTCKTGEALTGGSGARPCGAFSGPTSRMYADAVTMQAIAKLLSSASAVQRIVVDRTGRPGTFDLDLSFTNNTNAQPDPGEPPSIFTALPEQLGLRLRADTVPVEVTVVERFERPTPD